MGRRRRGDLPQMRLHAAYGTARVPIGHQDFYLGKFGSQKAHEAYCHFFRCHVHGLPVERPALPAAQETPDAAEWDRDAVMSPVAVTPADRDSAPARCLTVVELCARYLTWAEETYRSSDGRVTSSVDFARMGIRALRRFDDVPASEFGPLAFPKLMEQVVHEPLRRGKDAAGNPRRRPRVNINATVKSIRLIFKWAVGRELVPAAVYAALDDTATGTCPEEVVRPLVGGGLLRAIGV